VKPLYSKELENTLNSMKRLGWSVQGQIPSDVELIYRLNRNGDSFVLKRINLPLAKDMIALDEALTNEE
jgi:hypothetical protein